MIPIKVVRVVRRTWKPLAALGAGWFIAHKTSERVRNVDKLLSLAVIAAIAYFIWRVRK